MRTKIEKDTRLSELTKKKQDIVEKMGKANLAKVTIEKVIYEKPVGHNFQEHKKGNEESHIMAQIGG